MLASERLLEIENLVLKEGKVTVVELAQRFQVSTDLIRKDLRKFENNNVVQRVHGGAILKRKTIAPSTTVARISLFVKEKQHIANKALKLIADKSIIFLDISSASYYIAEALATTKRKITVITNMLIVTQLLSKNDNIQLISIGGEYDHYLGGFIDAPAQEQVRQFITDIAFIGTGGINPTNSTLSIHNVTDGQMKKTIISMSKCTYVVATHDHFSSDARYVFESLGNVRGVITDFGVTSDVVHAFKQAEIDLIY